MVNQRRLLALWRGWPPASRVLVRNECPPSGRRTIEQCPPGTIAFVGILRNHCSGGARTKRPGYICSTETSDRIETQFVVSPRFYGWRSGHANNHNLDELVRREPVTTE